MINQDERHNHWQQLAEQLGLEPERPAEPASAIREVAVPKSPPPRTARNEPLVRTEVAYDEESRFPRAGHRDAPAPVEAPEEARGADPDAETDVPPGDDQLDKPRGPEKRGRRRRRRGSKVEDKNAPTESTDAPAQTAGADEPPEEDDAPRGRSRRGRGRPRAESDKPLPRRADSVTEVDEVPAAKTAPALEDDDDLDDLSNWQAPSWQELIGSLYRPER